MALMARLRELVIEGEVAPEVAAKTALEELLDDVDQLIEDVTPLVERAARDIERDAERHTRQLAMAPAGKPQNRGRFGDFDQAQRQAQMDMPRRVYRLPDGKRVLWDDMTLDMIEVKIARMRTVAGSLVDHLGVLHAGRDLLRETKAKRLGDVPGWVEKIAARIGTAKGEVLRGLGASGEDEPPAGVGARRSPTKPNGPRSGTKDATAAKRANAGSNRSR